MTEPPITILDEEPTLDSPETLESTGEPKASHDSPEPTDEEMEDPTEQLMAANAELTEQVKRTSAEFQNFRRRQEEEAKRVKVRIREDIIRTMLPILDHLERTLTAADAGGDGGHEALLEGVKLIEKDVQKIFGEHGLAAIPAQGELFDAALHQAVMMQETEEVPDQTILQELQKGYTLGDRVIRPSMVQVARNS